MNPDYFMPKTTHENPNLPSARPPGSASHYEPKGYKFRDARNGEMMLVYEGEWKGWLAYRHPDGQWVSLRKATPADWHALGIAISEAHHAPNDRCNLHMSIVNGTRLAGSRGENEKGL